MAHGNVIWNGQDRIPFPILQDYVHCITFIHLSNFINVIGLRFYFDSFPSFLCASGTCSYLHITLFALLMFILMWINDKCDLMWIDNEKIGYALKKALEKVVIT
jgi:hypothetical protein